MATPRKKTPAQERETAAAPAAESAPATAEQPAAPAPSPAAPPAAAPPAPAPASATRRRLKVTGIVVGSVVAAGALFGGGVALGVHLPHGGPGSFGPGQGQFDRGFPGGSDGQRGPARPNTQSDGTGTQSDGTGS